MRCMLRRRSHAVVVAVVSLGGARRKLQRDENNRATEDCYETLAEHCTDIYFFFMSETRGENLS